MGQVVAMTHFQPSSVCLLNNNINNTSQWLASSLQLVTLRAALLQSRPLLHIDCYVIFSSFRFQGTSGVYSYDYNPCYPMNVNGYSACSDNTAAVSCYANLY